MTEYYSIRKDQHHSEPLSFDTVSSAVRNIFGPKDVVGGEILLETEDERVWLVPVLADRHGNYSSAGAPALRVNLIDVRRGVTARSDEALAALLRPLCVCLGWELVNQDGQILVDAVVPDER